jgi:hypothetical protein
MKDVYDVLGLGPKVRLMIQCEHGHWTSHNTGEQHYISTERPNGEVLGAHVDVRCPGAKRIDNRGAILAGLAEQGLLTRSITTTPDGASRFWRYVGAWHVDHEYEGTPPAAIVKYEREREGR